MAHVPRAGNKVPSRATQVVADAGRPHVLSVAGRGVVELIKVWLAMLLQVHGKGGPAGC